jgi:hypothetical protein
MTMTSSRTRARLGIGPARGASRRVPARRAALRRTRDHHAIASTDSLMRRAGNAHATGHSPDQAAAVVVEDLERAAAALTARTAPLIPGCGLLVAVTRLLLKAEPSSDAIAELFLGLSILCAVAGFSFLARALVIYAGRRTIGLPPTAGDIAFARDRLVRKHANAHRGGWLAVIALTCLIIGILFSVHITIHAG